MKNWTEERIDRRVWKRLPGNPFADYDPADSIALWSLWEMPSFSVGKLVRRGRGRPRSKPTPKACRADDDQHRTRERQPLPWPHRVQIGRVSAS